MKKRRFLFLLPLPGALVLLACCRAHPALASFWAARVFVPCARALGRVSARLPVPAVFPLAAGLAAFLLVSLCRRKFFRAFTALALTAAIFFSGWGVCCARPALKAASSAASPNDLAALCLSLAAQADANVSASPEIGAIFAAVPAALDAVAPRFSLPAGGFATPRASRMPQALSRLFTEGVFIPFTGEALVNEAMPAVCLPYVACHEAAHARGIASEADANLLAYFACAESDDPFFRFSGAICALSFALDALQTADPASCASVRAALSEPVTAALTARSAFWEPYRETPAAAAAMSVNESYLSSVGGQPEGAASYGAFVETLLCLR